MVAQERDAADEAYPVLVPLHVADAAHVSGIAAASLGEGESGRKLRGSPFFMCYEPWSMDQKKSQRFKVFLESKLIGRARRCQSQESL